VRLGVRKQRGCGFIDWVLGHKASLEGGFEDGLLEPCGIRRLGIEQMLRVGSSGERVRDAAENFCGFGGRWNGRRKTSSCPGWLLNRVLCSRA
jgi:hypothetical protein